MSNLQKVIENHDRKAESDDWLRLYLQSARDLSDTQLETESNRLHEEYRQMRLQQMSFFSGHTLRTFGYGILAIAGLSTILIAHTFTNQLYLLFLAIGAAAWYAHDKYLKRWEGGKEQILKNIEALKLVRVEREYIE